MNLIDCRRRSVASVLSDLGAEIEWSEIANFKIRPLTEANEMSSSTARSGRKKFAATEQLNRLAGVIVPIPESIR